MVVRWVEMTAAEGTVVALAAERAVAVRVVERVEGKVVAAKVVVAAERRRERRAAARVAAAQVAARVARAAATGVLRGARQGTACMWYQLARRMRPHIKGMSILAPGSAMRPQ